MAAVVSISAAVEGSVDEAVVDRLIRHIGGHPGTVYGKNGKPFLRDRIGGYNHAARHAPWVVLIDLDAEAECAPAVREAVQRADSLRRAVACLERLSAAQDQNLRIGPG